jgi:hypothetical protein
MVERAGAIAAAIKVLGVGLLLGALACCAIGWQRARADHAESTRSGPTGFESFTG